MATLVKDRTKTEEVLRHYVEAHDPGCLADDAVFTDVTTGMTWTGPEAIGAMLNWMYNGVFEAHVEDARVVIDADGERAIAEMTFAGIHRGEFAGVPPTGRMVRVPLVVAYDLAGGRITAARVHFNVASFQAQANA